MWPNSPASLTDILLSFYMLSWDAGWNLFLRRRLREFTCCIDCTICRSWWLCFSWANAHGGSQSGGLGRSRGSLWPALPRENVLDLSLKSVRFAAFCPPMMTSLATSFQYIVTLISFFARELRCDKITFDLYSVTFLSTFLLTCNDVLWLGSRSRLKYVTLGLNSVIMTSWPHNTNFTHHYNTLVWLVFCQ